jgi:hypothetical protein
LPRHQSMTRRTPTGYDIRGSHFGCLRYGVRDRANWVTAPGRIRKSAGHQASLPGRTSVADPKGTLNASLGDGSFEPLVKRRARRQRGSWAAVVAKSGRGPSEDSATAAALNPRGSNPEDSLTAQPPGPCPYQSSPMLITTLPKGPRARCSNACTVSSKR